MNHIEFIGPPGAGKSTIYSELINNDCLFGGIKQDALRRRLFQLMNPKYRPLYELLPGKIKWGFEHKCMRYPFGRKAFAEFIHEYPDFLDIILIAMDAASCVSRKRIFSMCRKTAERYQLGVSTVDDHETLCLDESFALRAMSLMWRTPDRSFPIKKYFEIVPIPKLLIHIDAPTELCMERQREREWIAVSRKWETRDPHEVQEDLRNICSTISDHVASKTSVITVENTENVDHAVDQIKTHLHNNTD